jgi:hypothetical protein
MATAFAFVKVLLKASTVLTSGPRSPCAHGHTKRHLRQVHVGPCGDPVRRDQFGQAFPRQDDHVGRYAAGELGTDGLRPGSLGCAGSGGDFGATVALEVRH